MTRLAEDQLSDLRAHLEAESDSLGEELAAHGKVSGGDWQGSSGVEKATEADPTDAADQIEELITNVPLVEELETRLHDVREALEKMDKGTYGICEVCKEEIPLKRLGANPAAKTCVAHA